MIFLQVFRISQTDWTVETLNLTPVGYLLEPASSETDLLAPSIYAHKISSGDTIYSMVFKPHNFQHGVKYPTIVQVYGGPEVQLVSNTFKVIIVMIYGDLGKSGFVLFFFYYYYFRECDICECTCLHLKAIAEYKLIIVDLIIEGFYLKVIFAEKWAQSS